MSNSTVRSVTGPTVFDCAARWVMRESTALVGTRCSHLQLGSAPGAVNSRISTEPYSLHISPQLH